MKIAIGLLIVLVTAGAQAGENLVCALMKNSNRSEYISVKVDLTKPLESSYYPEDGLEVGNNAYSFALEVTRESDQLSLIATFQDTNDEVGQASWDVDLSQSTKGKAIVTEPVKDTSGKSSMTFVCYHNK